MFFVFFSSFWVIALFPLGWFAVRDLWLDQISCPASHVGHGVKEIDEAQQRWRLRLLFLLHHHRRRRRRHRRRHHHHHNHHHHHHHHHHFLNIHGWLEDENVWSIIHLVFVLVFVPGWHYAVYGTLESKKYSRFAVVVWSVACLFVHLFVVVVLLLLGFLISLFFLLLLFFFFLFSLFFFSSSFSSPWGKLHVWLGLVKRLTHPFFFSSPSIGWTLCMNNFVSTSNQSRFFHLTIPPEIMKLQSLWLHCYQSE